MGRAITLNEKSENTVYKGTIREDIMPRYMYSLANILPMWQPILHLGMFFVCTGYILSHVTLRGFF